MNDSNVTKDGRGDGEHSWYMVLVLTIKPNVALMWI